MSVRTVCTLPPRGVIQGTKPSGPSRNHRNHHGKLKRPRRDPNGRRPGLSCLFNPIATCFPRRIKVHRSDGMYVSTSYLVSSGRLHRPRYVPVRLPESLAHVTHGRIMIMQRMCRHVITGRVRDGQVDAGRGPLRGDAPPLYRRGRSPTRRQHCQDGERGASG